MNVEDLAPLMAIMYVSSSRVGLGYSDIFDILESSRRSNAQLDITGVLLYFRGRFMQYIEGPRDALESVFARIRSDPRHHDLTELLHEPIKTREFSGWRLAFAAPDVPGIASTVAMRDMYEGFSCPRWLLKNFLDHNSRLKNVPDDAPGSLSDVERFG